MPDKHPYNYAVIRVVPHVEREEFVNAGVILFCKAKRFLRAKICADYRRIKALAPSLDEKEVREQLELIPRICAGGDSAGSIGRESQSERFHWLTAPRSTIIQTSPVHAGLCSNPETELNDLFDQLVTVSPN
ncbi:MAG: DUF3037 domain-containing protein [Candidatus Marinimicrobia bacterium]|nr:DUF3037 domain-containing protein [Candidatus Neomarinimicrobiota bacterium]MCF7827757.1 DUF3037 domain-containing protein [Candidatus Neomarinimicrobiota bacterium]MCF7881443.1 DUF3037 domain-containing protein [Candidatus Neomarinimicrobiota bacterium]